MGELEVKTDLEGHRNGKMLTGEKVAHGQSAAVSGHRDGPIRRLEAPQRNEPAAHPVGRPAQPQRKGRVPRYTAALNISGLSSV